MFDNDNSEEMRFKLTLWHTNKRQWLVGLKFLSHR